MTSKRSEKYKSAPHFLLRGKLNHVEGKELFLSSIFKMCKQLHNLTFNIQKSIEVPKHVYYQLACSCIWMGYELGRQLSTAFSELPSPKPKLKDLS